MTGAGAQQIDLARRLIAMMEEMTSSRRSTLSDEAIRELPAQVQSARQQALLAGEDPRLIDAEAACAVELLIALTYARAEHNQNREARMVMFLNSFTPFMKSDLSAAERAAGIAAPQREYRR